MRKLWSVHPVWKTPSRFPNASQNWARGINILSIILTVSVNISTAPRQKLAAIGVYLPPLWTSQIISMNALQVQVRGRCIQFKRKGKESSRPRFFWSSITSKSIFCIIILWWKLFEILPSKHSFIPEHVRGPAELRDEIVVAVNHAAQDSGPVARLLSPRWWEFGSGIRPASFPS